MCLVVRVPGREFRFLAPIAGQHLFSEPKSTHFVEENPNLLVVISTEFANVAKRTVLLAQS